MGMFSEIAKSSVVDELNSGLNKDIESAKSYIDQHEVYKELDSATRGLIYNAYVEGLLKAKKLVDAIDIY